MTNSKQRKPKTDFVERLIESMKTTQKMVDNFKTGIIMVPKMPRIKPMKDYKLEALLKIERSIQETLKIQEYEMKERKKGDRKNLIIAIVGIIIAVISVIVGILI